MKLEFVRTPNGYKVVVDNNLRVKKYLGIPVFLSLPSAADLNDNDPNLPAIGFYDGNLVVWDGDGWIEAGGGLKAEDIGQGLKIDPNGKLILDLATSDLVAPSISANWVLKKNDNSSEYIFTNSSSKALVVDKGVIANLAAQYSYPTPNGGQTLPITVTGSFGGVLPAPNTPVPLNINGITSNSQNTQAYSVTLAKPKSGLIVANNQVQFPSGNDTKADNISIAFKGRGCLAFFPDEILTPTQIQSVLNTGSTGNAAFQDGKARSFANVTANGYTYYLLDNSFGRPTAVSQDGVDAVFGAFRFLADVTIINAAGIPVLITVMRSNAPNAFNNRNLSFS